MVGNLEGYVDRKSRQSARKRWASLLCAYQQCIVADTNFWEAYRKVIPGKHHRAVGKNPGQANPIERLNNIVRQYISRLERKRFSFSEKIG